MSCWACVRGLVEVEPMGRTQAEKDYILHTVLDHLPRVTGSEGDMNVYVVKQAGTNYSSPCDEFGYLTDNLVDRYGYKSRKGWLTMQRNYFIVIDGKLRNRYFTETYRAFIKWLCRFSKRILVNDVMVSVSGRDLINEEEFGEGKVVLIRDEYDKFYDIWEHPSWYKRKKSEPESENWCEYLMWQGKESV